MTFHLGHRQPQMQTLPGLLRQLSSVHHKSWCQQSMPTSQPVSLGICVNTRSLSFSDPRGNVFQEPRIYLTPALSRIPQENPYLSSHFTKIPINHASQEPLGDSFRTLNLGFSQVTRPERDQTPPFNRLQDTGPGSYRGI